MENLLNLANELLKDDSYKNTSFVDNKPDGDYLCTIDKIEFKENANGTQWFNVKAVIIDGDYIEQPMFLNYFLTEKSIKRAIGDLMVLIDVCGYEPSIEMFSDFDVLNKNLQVLIGSEITVNKKTSKAGNVYYTVKGGE